MQDQYGLLNKVEEKTSEIRSIMSTCTDACLLLADSGGNIVHLNALGLENIFGYQEEEVVGTMTLRQLLSWPDLVRVLLFALSRFF